jgi:N-acetylglucosaminyldiphosphoundecaprenol N-acetyl-beta-D-mannosaminyltransferase
MTLLHEEAFDWPPKHDLFGVQVSPVSCQEACDAIMRAAKARASAVVSAFSVHALIEAATAPDLKNHANQFAIIAPDGQPVRWALNWIHGTRLQQNLRGADLMLQLCRHAAEEGVSIYLYGSKTDTLDALKGNLINQFPDLQIAGVESPPFRPLTPQEDVEMVERINASGAGLVFLGLGCPKQDYFAAEHAGRIRAVQICVGAAFDFHACTKAVAPEWMQRRGVEWVFRLYQEPRRLWKRYLITNTIFLSKLTGQFVRHRLSRASGEEKQELESVS